MYKRQKQYNGEFYYQDIAVKEEDFCPVDPEERIPFEETDIDYKQMCIRDRPQKDYYVSFGIHFYCLLYARFMEKEDPEHTALFKERSKTFSESFIYWFDDEGKALPFGRSLTYRRCV